MRRTVAALALVALVTAACTGGEGVSAPDATAVTQPRSIGDPTPPPPPADPRVAEARPELLAAITLFPDDLPEPYAALPLDTLETGYRPAGGDLANALEPDDEADDIIRFGQLGEFTISYGTPDGPGIAVAATQFTAPTGAAGYLEDWVSDLERGATEPPADRFFLSEFYARPHDGLGDQAVRATYVSVFRSGEEERERDGAVMAIRQADVIAWVWAFGDGAPAVVDELGPVVAARLADALAGRLGRRDPTVLGLADPPTLALQAFAFDYSYGIESGEFAFTVTVEGVFEGPDLTSCRTTTAEGTSEPSVTHVVAAGTRVWVGGPSGFSETPLRDPTALSALAGCPGHPNFWEITRFHRLPVDGGTDVTIGGLAATTADLAADPDALATAGFIDAEIAEFDRYRVTVARDGGWLLRADIERTVDVATALALFGIPADGTVAPAAPAKVFDSLEITRVNDPTIRVTLPLLAG